MVHGNLAKSILNAGWGYLVQRLQDKAASAGRVVVVVDPRGSQCGAKWDRAIALEKRPAVYTMYDILSRFCSRKTMRRFLWIVLNSRW